MHDITSKIYYVMWYETFFAFVINKMDPTRDYYAQRLGVLWKVMGGMEKKSYQCDFLRNLSVIGSGGVSNKEGVMIATYPVSLGIQTRGKKIQVPLFVKETRAGYNEAIPYFTLSELYILKNVIYRMFSRNISPHFAFPVYQLVLDTEFDVSEQIVDSTTNTIRPEKKLCPSVRTRVNGNGDMAVYSFTEHLDPKFNISMFEFSVLGSSSVEDFRGCMFQILYNLACFEDVKLRHGDLHLKNIMVRRMYPYPWVAKYSLDKNSQYLLKSSVFVNFIDFDRSKLHEETGELMSIPENVFERTSCVSKSFEQSISDVVEDCWKTWNPYADFTRMFAHLLYQWKLSPQAFDIMFPDYQLKVDVVSLMGDYRQNLFGRPSITDLRRTVDHEVLKRTTPKRLFVRFAEQFVGDTGDFSVIRVTGEVPYPSFGLDM